MNSKITHLYAFLFTLSMASCADTSENADSSHAAIELQCAPPRAPVDAFQKVRAFLQAQSKIRMFIEMAQNNGHQAATLTVMRRLRELGFEGDYEVIYDDDVGTKLEYLMPGFDRRKAVNKAPKASFVGREEFTKHSHNFAQLPLGITGGWDVKGWNDIRLTKVNYHLKLQPLRFPHDGISIERAYQILPAQGFVVPMPELYPLGYVYDVSERATLEELIENEIRTDARLASKADGLRSLVKALDAKQFDFMPVYGTVAWGGVAKTQRLVELMRKLKNQHPSLFPRKIVMGIFTENENSDINTLLRFSEEVSVPFEAISTPLVSEHLASPGDIMMVKIGRVTQNVFEGFDRRATLPALSGGANTTTLCRLLGKPYIETVLNNVTELASQTLIVIFFLRCLLSYV